MIIKLLERLFSVLQNYQEIMIISKWIKNPTMTFRAFFFFLSSIYIPPLKFSIY